MKKKHILPFFLLLFGIFSTVHLKADDIGVTIPKDGKVYYIQAVASPHTGKFVGQHKDNSVLCDLTVGDAAYTENQQFKFISAGKDYLGHDLFYLQLQSNGLYLSKSDYYSFLRDGGDKFWMEQHSEGGVNYLRIRNENSFDGMGLDVDNTGVWMDKGINRLLYSFILIPVEEESEPTPDNYDGNVYYIQSVGSPHEGKFVGQHSDISAGSDLTVSTATYTENQQFMFISAGKDNQGNDLFYLQLQSNQLYLAKDNYNSRLKGIGTKFWVEQYNDNGVDYVRIRNENASNGMGLDSDNSGVWLDKGTGYLRYCFLLIPVDGSMPANKELDALEKAIRVAEEALEQSGAYDQHAKFVLETAVMVAHTITDIYSKEEIKSVTVDLGVKTQQFLDAKILVRFNPKAGVKYHIFMSESDAGGTRQYIGTTNHSTLVSQDYNEDSEDQLWYFEAVAGKEDVFYIKSACKSHSAGGKYLNGSLAPTVDDKNSAMPWTIKYVKSKKDGAHYFSFMSSTGEYITFSGNSINKTGNGQANTSILAIDDVEADRGALHEQLTTAQNLYNSTIEGNFPGQYPAEARTDFKQVIDAAFRIFDEDVTQQEVDDMTESLINAMEDYRNSIQVLLPKYENLYNEINKALNLYEATQEGDLIGQYPVAAHITFRDAIDSAMDLFGKKDVSQSEIDAMTAALEAAIENYKEAKIKSDFEDLQAKVDIAIALYESTTEGTLPGEYPADARVAFKAIIDQAAELLANGNASKTEVEAMVAELETAIENYKNAKIPEDSKVSDNLSLSEPLVYVSGNTLHISGLSEASQILVYDISGRLVMSVSCQESNYQCTLPNHGSYIVMIEQLTGLKKYKIVVQ